MRARHIYALGLSLGIAAAGRAGVDYDDGHGRIWRQLPTTLNLTWKEIASVCPVDGLTPANGPVGAVNFTGWTWATPDQVAGLFSYFTPDILSDPCLGGAEYTLPGIFLLGGGYIDPTFAFYSDFGANLYANGWTAELTESGAAVQASASASYPFFDGSFCVTGQADPASRPLYTGVWLWRASISGDYDGNGHVDLSDLGVTLANYGMTSGATRANGDFDGDGDVDLSDLGIVLANFGCC